MSASQCDLKLNPMAADDINGELQMADRYTQINDAQSGRSVASSARQRQAAHCIRFAVVTSEEIAATLIDRAIELRHSVDAYPGEFVRVE